MAKKIASANEIFDFLSTLPTNADVTVCHMNVVKLKKGKKILNPLTNRHKKIVDYDEIGNIIGVNNLTAIISLTRYSNLMWQNHDQFADDYGKFVDSNNQIRREFGLTQMEKRKKNIERIKYGDDKLTLGKKNNQGKSYIEQNTFNCDKEVYYYGVDENGDIIGEFTFSQLCKYLDNDRVIGGLRELQKLTKDDNVIDSYIDRIIKLQMEYTQFLNDRVLYIIGKYDDGECYFVNDRPTAILEGLNVNLSDIMDYIRVNFYKDFRMMVENRNRKRTLKESVNRVQIKLLQNLGLTQEDYENFRIYDANKLMKIYGDKFWEIDSRIDQFEKEYNELKNKNINENMKKQIIRLTEQDLHRVIKESVRRIVKEVKDTTFVQVKNDAKANFDKAMSDMQQIGCNFKVDFKVGRNEDGYPHIGAEMDPRQIKTDKDFDFYWKALYTTMKHYNFVLDVGPAMGWCEWSYNDERLHPMYKKHNERDDARWA